MELIKITETGGQRAVSARDLHEFLEVKNHFTQWIEDNINQFEENIDYQAVKVFLNASNGIGGTYKQDWVLTLDCAKQLAMMSKVPKGTIARKYFIECEKKVQSLLPTTYKDALKALLEQVEENEKKTKAIEEMKPKADFFDAVTESTDTIDLGELAKVLNIGIGRNKLFEVLRKEGILMKGNIPKQTHISNGWFKLVECKFETSNGTHIHLKPVVFQKGVDGIRKILNKK